MASKYLSMDEYSQLFEHIVLAEYDNLFHNTELRCDLGLTGGQTARFAVEYLNAALFLLDDLMPDSRLTDTVRASLPAQVRANVFRSILPKDAPQEAHAQYILYSLKRSAQLAALYHRNDETMKLLIEDCLAQAQLEDTIARLPQQTYLMQLLPGIVQLFCDLLCSVQQEEELPPRFRIDMPEGQ